MAPGDTARLYHRITSASPPSPDDPRVLAGFTPNVRATFPAHCKAYPPGLPVVALPRAWPPATRLDLARLARLLHLSAGVVRLAERRDGRRYFRAAGSAGGRFPYELYVAARDVDGLPDGVHWFDPLEHALVQVGPPPAGEATTLVLTGIPWRTGWRYAERGFRHLYWDAGAILANTLAVGEDAALAPRLRAVFPDAAVTRLVGADGVHEFPLAIVTLGEGAPAIGPGGPAAPGQVDRLPPVEFPLVTAAQRAGDTEELGPPWPAGPRTPAGVDEVILRRISTRVLDPRAAVRRDVFEASLAAALRGSRVEHFVAVHAVDGLEPGLYRHGALVRRGDLRAELFALGWDQELPRDASFVVISAADLERLDDRGYREAQLDAGLVSGRLHLEAFARGLGATGMTFVDERIPAVLGEPLAGLLLTCVGAPTYRHRPGGPPGAPTRMRPLAA
ncbi:MAG TPA: hypothetical protein VH418_16920 [Solirubrobacteraceae bacterium]|jgi:hypothetical protein